MNRFVETKRVFKRKEFIEYLHGMYEKEIPDKSIDPDFISDLMYDMLLDCADIIEKELVNESTGKNY